MGLDLSAWLCCWGRLQSRSSWVLPSLYQQSDNQRIRPRIRHEESLFLTTPACLSWFPSATLFWRNWMIMGWTGVLFAGWKTDWLPKPRVVVNGIKYRWQPITSGVLQASVLGPALFSIFIKWSGWRCQVHPQFADDRLGGSADLLEGRKALQRSGQAGLRDQGQLFNLVWLNKAKC